MRIFLIVTFGLCCWSFSVQSQECLSSGGNYDSGSSGSISWTLGELATTTCEAGDMILTQGQQQSRFEVTSLNELNQPDYAITLSPNPAKDFVHLQVDRDDLSRMEYFLYDSRGVLLKKERLKNKVTTINFSNLAPSVYLVQITAGNRVVKTFKIIKTY